MNYVSGTFNSEQPIKISEIDKRPSKCDCVAGGIVNGFIQRFLKRSASYKRPGPEISKKPRKNH